MFSKGALPACGAAPRSKNVPYPFLFIALERSSSNRGHVPPTIQRDSGGLTLSDNHQLLTVDFFVILQKCYPLLARLLTLTVLLRVENDCYLPRPTLTWKPAILRESLLLLMLVPPVVCMAGSCGPDAAPPTVYLLFVPMSRTQTYNSFCESVPRTHRGPCPAE